MFNFFSRKLPFPLHFGSLVSVANSLVTIKLAGTKHIQRNDACALPWSVRCCWLHLNQKLSHTLSPKSIYFQIWQVHLHRLLFFHMENFPPFSTNLKVSSANSLIWKSRISRLGKGFEYN